MTPASILSAVLHGLLITYALWLLYVLVMGLYRAKLLDPFDPHGVHCD